MKYKEVVFNNKIYRRSLKSKYYFEYNKKVEDRIGKPQLHRAVWEYYNGKIPENCHIHHIDGDIDNNDISNLECIDVKDHLKYHGKKNWENEEYREKMKDYSFFNEERQAKAKAWHKSPEGILWHKNHAINSILKNKDYPTKKCLWCENVFKPNIKNQKYCSIKCQVKCINYSKTKICQICGKEFHSTSYKAKTCSKKCQYELRKT